jgi:hypothetical protein
MHSLMDKKYKTYKWNIEVNMQKDALRHEALRECLSDSTKADVFNLSSTSGNNGNSPINAGALMSGDFDDENDIQGTAVGKDGSLIMVQNDTMF